MTTTPRRRRARALAALLTAPLVAATALLSTPAHADDPQRARPAADFLYREARTGVPGQYGTGIDTGLTIDAMWGMMAAGSSADQVNEVGNVVAANAKNYTTGALWGQPKDITAGATGKTLLAAASLNRDPKNFGGVDLRAQASSTLKANGQAFDINAETPDQAMSANLFGQSLVMMGLARTGDLPPATVDFLVNQQCASGHFRIFYYGGGTCDAPNGDSSAPDRDATAMGVMALLAARDKGVNTAKANTALNKALDYLEKDQGADGGFRGGVSTDQPNANSTGLAAAALAAGGRTTSANKAATWMNSVQLTAQNAGKMPTDFQGAIAYTPESLARGQQNGLPTTDPGGRDQWRRATAQAILAFAPRSLHSVTIRAQTGVASVSLDPVTSVAPSSAVRATGVVSPARAGVPVQLVHRPAGGGTEQQVGSATTGVDGRFAINGSFTGQGVFEVQARAEGRSSDWVWYARSNPALGSPTRGKFCGLRDAGCFQQYQLGSIYDSGSTSPQWILGAIRETWGALGWENGQLGYPTSNEVCGLRDGGCVHRFQGGLVYYSPQAGTHAVWGEIGRVYAGLGWENSQLGYPTSGEICGLRDGGCVQRFQGGLLYWSPASGAHPVWGAIEGRYADLRWENSQLGYPTTSEICGLRDSGCFQRFQGGALYWSPASGAWPSWGAIGDHWGRNGWENGRYGYPVGYEQCGPAGGAFECRQPHQGGWITWNSATGVR